MHVSFEMSPTRVGGPQSGGKALLERREARQRSQQGQRNGDRMT